MCPLLHRRGPKTEVRIKEFRAAPKTGDRTNAPKRSLLRAEGRSCEHTSALARAQYLIAILSFRHGRGIGTSNSVVDKDCKLTNLCEPTMDDDDDDQNLLVWHSERRLTSIPSP
jgi:hypothetical protein